MKWDHDPDDIEAISNEWDGLVCDIYEVMKRAKNGRSREIKGAVVAYMYARYFGYSASELLSDARQTWEMNRHG